MKFACKSDKKEVALFHTLPRHNMLEKYEYIIGLDHLSKQFFILLKKDNNLDLNFIIPSNRLNINLRRNIEEGMLHDSIKKSFSLKNIKYKIILLDEILKVLIEKTFENNIKSEHYEPCIIPDSESTLTFGLNYMSNIDNSISKTTLFNIFKQPLNNSEPLSLKTTIKKYFNECINTIHFTNADEYSKYLTLQNYIMQVLHPIKQNKTFQYKKIKRLMSIFSNEMLYDLSKVFLNSQIDDKCRYLMNKIQKIKKLNTVNTRVKIPCGHIPMIINHEGILKYDLYGSSFEIPTQIKNHHQNEMVPFIKFINSIISLGKFDELNTACEKLILLNC